LEGLNQSVKKNPVKAAVAEFYVMLVMFVEGVHRAWSCVVRYRELKADERLCDDLLPRCSPPTADAQREKDFFFEEKVLQLPPEQKVGLWLKRANGINGGKPVGRCRVRIFKGLGNLLLPLVKPLAFLTHK
jgi:hypothetical protein